MIAVAVVAGTLACWLIVAPPRSALVRLSAGSGQAASRRGRGLVVVGGAVAGSVIVAGLAVLAGRWAVVGVAVGILAATVAIIVSGRRRAARARRVQREVADAAEVLAALIRIGAVPTVALRTAAGECPVLGPAARSLDVGADVPRQLMASGLRPGAGGLIEIGRAWQVCQATGAPLAGALDRVRIALRAQTELAAVVDSELSSARATGQVLAVLPFAGVGIGYAFGGDPLGFFLSSAPGRACLVVGVGLACAGVLWNERLAGGAAGQNRSLRIGGART